MDDGARPGAGFDAAGALAPSGEELGLITDLYQLTMLAAYRRHRAGVRGVFELTFRELPPGRAFLLAAGLEPCLAFLSGLRFPPDAIAALRRLPALASLGEEYFDSLARLRFTGDVWAVREGTVIFPGEPVLRVEGPIGEAQLVETYLLAAVSFSTMVASKAARVRLAAGARELADFGTRRAHGPQAGCWAARAAYIGGVDATSNVWAATRVGIPASGTMAHSFVLSFPAEHDAFVAYADTFPDRAVLLVDTLDTIAAVESAAEDPSLQFVAVRLDSGDLLELATRCRALLDRRGRTKVRIMASGDLDESRIAGLLAAGAPIDGFGVGTRLVTSADAPSLQAVYKLVQVEEADGVIRGVAKHSAGKPSRPWAKQVWRRCDAGGIFVEDVVCRSDTAAAQGPLEPLLEPWMRGGRLSRALPGLAAYRRHARSQLARLPVELRALDGAPRYPVRFDAGLTGGER